MQIISHYVLLRCISHLISDTNKTRVGISLHKVHIEAVYTWARPAVTGDVIYHRWRDTSRHLWYITGEVIRQRTWQGVDSDCGQCISVTRWKMVVALRGLVRAMVDHVTVNQWSHKARYRKQKCGVFSSGLTRNVNAGHLPVYKTAVAYRSRAYVVLSGFVGIVTRRRLPVSVHAQWWPGQVS